MKAESDHHAQDVTQLYELQPPRRCVLLTWVTALPWPKEMTAQLGLSSERLDQDQKHNRGSRGGGGGRNGVRGEHWGHSAPSNFLCNKAVDETCQRTSAFLTHTLLIVAGEGFQSRGRDAKKEKKNSGRKKTTSASSGDTMLKTVTDECQMQCFVCTHFSFSQICLLDVHVGDVTVCVKTQKNNLINQQHMKSFTFQQHISNQAVI